MTSPVKIAPIVFDDLLLDKIRPVRTEFGRLVQFVRRFVPEGKRQDAVLAALPDLQELCELAFFDEYRGGLR